MTTRGTCSAHMTSIIAVAPKHLECAELAHEPHLELGGSQQTAASAWLSTCRRGTATRPFAASSAAFCLTAAAATRKPVTGCVVVERERRLGTTAAESDGFAWLHRDGLIDDSRRVDHPTRE